MRWDNLCGPAFNQGHRKFKSKNVRNCAIPQYQRVLIFTSPTDSWTYYIPLESIAYHRDNEAETSNDVVHFQWRSNKVITNVSIFKRVIMYVFINVRKTISYAIGKRVASSSVRLLHMPVLYNYNYIVTIVVFATRTIYVSFLFAKY